MRLFPMASLMALPLLGCGNKTPTPAEESDTDTDADADADTDADADADADGSFECDTQVAFWRLSGPAGTYTATVDTVSAATTFDPAFAAYEPTPFPADPAAALAVSDDAVPIGGADDTFDCTFPPADYQCPEGSITTAGGDVLFVVYSASNNCAGLTADYTLTVPGLTATLFGNYTLPQDTGGPI